MQKDHKWIIVLIVAFVSGYIAQFAYFYGFQQNEIITLETTYKDVDIPDFNMTQSETIQILKPFGASSELLPAVILLHGDDSSSKFMNCLKLAFLKNNYLVALVDENYFQLSTFVLINETIDYLSTRDDVNSSQIGFVGHSHGGHYGVIMSMIRNETINSVVLANFGDLSYWYDDYYDYYRNFIAKNNSLPSTYDSYIYNNYTLQLPMNLKTPNNLLMVTDDWDDRLDGLNPEFYFSNFTENAYNTRNQLYGNFDDGTARKIFVTKSIFGHASGLYHPRSLQAQVEWMNDALGYEGPTTSLAYTVGIVIFTFGSIVILFIVALALISYIVPYLNEQKKLLSRIKQKLGLEEFESMNFDADIEKKNISDAAKARGIKDLTLIEYLFIPVGIISIFTLFFLIPFSFNNLYDIQAFPITIIELLGINVYRSILSASWPYMFMVFLVIGYWLTWEKLIKDSEQTRMKPLSELKMKDFLISGIYAVEIYGLYHIMANLALNNVIGSVFMDIYLQNLILGVALIYFLNRIWFVSRQNESENAKNTYIRNAVLLLIIFLIPSIPQFCYSLLTVGYVDVGSLFSLFAAAFFVAVLNPPLKNRKISLLTITIFDYFVMLFAFEMFEVFF